ncbi:ABC transporter substrate-binding protein [Bifidobacterium pullorum]|uniref:ABC transporter substrate-binding protein n=1 Tax=Bifidobacterium pullorum TaxID=78448 RepID=UPI0024AD91E5|nr:extracellular solute-binding protein [Bifidobacterium pullorum]
MKKLSFAKRILAMGLAAATLFSVASCGSGDAQGDGDASNSSESASITMDDVNAALESDKDITLTYWTWRTDIEQGLIDAFQEEYPHIKIEVTSTGAAADHYTKFQNVIKAGKDIPDVVQLEYDYLPQYAVTGALLNFSSDSIEDEMGSLYNEAAWANSHVAGGLYGTPFDQGPEIMFVRHDVLDQYGIEVPTTWEEFEQAGIALHKADPNKYMSFIDTTDVRYMAQIIRSSGAIPWTVNDVENVELSLTDDKVLEAVDFIQRLIDEDVLEPVANKSDEYNRGFAEGRWAIQFDGCWKGTSFVSQQPQLAGGKMEPYVTPAWGDGSDGWLTGEVGGSMIAVTSSCAKEKQAAAIAFANYLCSNEDSVKAMEDMGSVFLAAKSFQDDPEQAEVTNDYFGMAANKVYFDAASKLSEGWSILPFNSQYATTYKDVIVPELKKGGDLRGAFAEWQENLKSYAENQGFNITVKE